MSIFKKLGWFFKQEKKSYIIGVFSLMMVALVQLVPPKVIGVVVDEIVNKEIRLTKIIVWVALLIGAGLAYLGECGSFGKRATDSIISSFHKNG